MTAEVMTPPQPYNIVAKSEKGKNVFISVQLSSKIRKQSLDVLGEQKNTKVNVLIKTETSPQVHYKIICNNLETNPWLGQKTLATFLGLQGVEQHVGLTLSPAFKLLETAAFLEKIFSKCIPVPSVRQKYIYEQDDYQKCVNFREVPRDLSSPSKLVLEIDLPGEKSMRDFELDIDDGKDEEEEGGMTKEAQKFQSSLYILRLSIRDRWKLEYPITAPIDVDECKALFLKAKEILRITFKLKLICETE